MQWSLHHNKTSPCLRSNSFLYIYGTLLHFSTILSMSLACTHNVSVCVTCVSWLFTLTCLLPSFLVAPVLNYTFIIYYKATSILATLVVSACLLQQREKKMEESSFVLTTSLSTLRTILKCLQKQILLSYSYMWYTTVPIPHPYAAAFVQQVM